MKAKDTIRALETLQAAIPLEISNELEIIFSYIHQQIFIDMQLEEFTQGFGYKPEKELEAKMLELAKKIGIAYSDDVDG